MTSVLPSLGIGAGRVTWVQVDSGIHVASRAGEYVGYAERTGDGHFVGFDGGSTPVGHYSSLNDVQRAVEQAVPREAASVSPAVESGFHFAAAATGLIALCALATAVLSMPVL